MLDIELYAASGRPFDSHYKMIRPLSTDGGTADVWLALDMNTVKAPDAIGDITRMSDDEIEKLGLIVAIKVYRPQNALDVEGEQRFRDEYMIVFNCHHTNLIHPTHFSIFHETPYLVLPYCKLGSSEKLIGKMTDVDDIWKYILDVSSGLAYLHALTPPIIHQDIKPGNVLIDDNMNYSITDFGISSKRGGDTTNDYDEEERSGTMAYMAPERYHEGVVPGPASDIWAFGATLCEILTGNVPYGDEGGLTQTEQKAPMPALPNLPADIQRLIHACLAPNPEDRPTAQYISEAAALRQYPIKRKRSWVNILIASIIALLIGGTAVFFLHKPEPKPKYYDEEEEEEVYQPTPEEIYQMAMEGMTSDNPDTLKAAAQIMDSLGNTGYVPAAYEMAFTYGWYSDSASVARKKLLDIDIYTSGTNRYLPKDVEWSNMAVALFTKVLEQNDTAYASFNADAAYRLACYYERPNDIFQRNEQLSRKYLVMARDWAGIAGDSDMKERAEDGLKNLGN